MTKPIVVQGTAVSDPYANHPDSGFAGGFQDSTQTNHTTLPQTLSRERNKKRNVRDPLFAVLLYINVGAIAAVAFAYGLPAYQNTESVDFYSGYMYAASIAAVFSLLFSGLALGVMMAIPSLLIKTSLIFSVIITGVWAVLAFYFWTNLFRRHRISVFRPVSVLRPEQYGLAFHLRLPILLQQRQRSEIILVLHSSPTSLLPSLWDGRCCGHFP